MIDLSNYSCDKCKRAGSWHCKHCYHTADNPPTKFKRNETASQKLIRKMKEFDDMLIAYESALTQPIEPEKEKENKIMNTTMYGLKLYISFDDLNAYIHNHTDTKYKDHTFVPVKVEVNDLDLSIDISLISAGPVEVDQCRYKLNLNELPKENDKCKD